MSVISQICTEASIDELISMVKTDHAGFGNILYISFNLSTKPVSGDGELLINASGIPA